MSVSSIIISHLIDDFIEFDDLRFCITSLYCIKQNELSFNSELTVVYFAKDQILVYS